MNLKDFFKPSKWKIIIFLIIPGVFHTCAFGMTAGINYLCTYNLYPMILYVPFVLLNLFPRIEAAAYPQEAYYNGALISPIETIITLITSIIIAYLIACLIIFLIKKMKNKK